MATVWINGVPWFDGARAAAERRGIADAVQEIARDYRAGTGSYAVAPEVDKSGQPAPGRFRVIRDGHAAIMDFNTVIGYVVITPQDRAAAAEAKRPALGIARSRGARGGSRGPRDYRELEAWLNAAGYEVGVTRAGHVAVSKEGQTVYTMASTPSDHRSMANAVATLRRVTGLPLREARR